MYVCSLSVCALASSLRFVTTRSTSDSSFYLFCLISRFKLKWIKSNLINDTAPINFNAEPATVTSAPASTNVAAPPCPKISVHLQITSRSHKCTVNSRGTCLYQSTTRQLSWGASQMHHLFMQYNAEVYHYVKVFASTVVHICQLSADNGFVRWAGIENQLLISSNARFYCLYYDMWWTCFIVNTIKGISIEQPPLFPVIIGCVFT